MNTERYYHLIECRDAEENENVAGTRKPMLQVIGEWYKEGYRFLESFELAKRHYGVFTKDVEFMASTAPIGGEPRPSKVSEWPRHVIEINRPRLVEHQYAVGRVWNIAGYVMDWHGCDGDTQITESIGELFELVNAVQDVMTNAGIAIALNGEGLNHNVTRRAFVEQIAEIIHEQAINGLPMHKNEPMISEADAKTLANVAYNRAGSQLPTPPTQEDFERWWTEFRKENGFAPEPSSMVSKLDAKGWAYTMYMRAKMRTEREGDACTNDFEWAWNEFCDRKEVAPTTNEEPAAITTEQQEFNSITEHLKNLATKHLGWNEFERKAAKKINSGYGDFYEAISRHYGLKHSKATVTKTRKEFFESIANNIIQYRKDNPTGEQNPKADPITLDEVLPQIKVLATLFFGWRLWGESVTNEDKDVQLFHTVVADEYELELDVEATNTGMDLFNITRLQYLQKVAQAVADALNKRI